MISERYITIGTRGSNLALWQAELVATRLRDLLPSMPIVITPISTHGDRDQLAASDEGSFTDELELALHRGEIDLAIHCLKDLPTEIDTDVMIGAVPHRGSPYDVLISRQRQKLHELPLGATIGVDSLLRVAQLKAVRPDITILSLRGDVPTQMATLQAEDSEYDALVLAVASLDRSGLVRHITEILTPEVMLPTAGQGAVVVQCRAGDHPMRRVLRRIDDIAARLEIEAERALQTILEIDDQLPVAVLARFNHRDATLSLTGRVLSASGEISVTVRGMIDLVCYELTVQNGALIQHVIEAAQQLGDTLEAQAIRQHAGNAIQV